MVSFQADGHDTLQLTIELRTISEIVHITCERDIITGRVLEIDSLSLGVGVTNPLDHTTMLGGDVAEKCLSHYIQLSRC